MTDGVERPEPPNDPFRCSICGAPLSTLERLHGEEHCDGCIREYLGEYAVRDRYDTGDERPEDGDSL